MAKRETITIDGRVYAKFILYPKEIRDGTHRCIACGQIDEPECHDPKCCPACSERSPASEDKAMSADDRLVERARFCAQKIRTEFLVNVKPEFLDALASALEASEVKIAALTAELAELKDDIRQEAILIGGHGVRVLAEQAAALTTENATLREAVERVERILSYPVHTSITPRGWSPRMEDESGMVEHAVEVLRAALRQEVKR